MITNFLLPTSSKKIDFCIPRYAGGERLVVSLWQVSDEGTAVFMQEFYKQILQNNKSPNEALRATQLKMWSQDKWRNPNYWAAFAFLGEWR